MLGAVGGLLGSVEWFWIYAALCSRECSITAGQDVYLASTAGSGMLGLAGAILSRRRVRPGGAIMLLSAGLAIGTLLLGDTPFSGGGGVLFFLPVYGWWSVILLFGGLFGIRKETTTQNVNGKGHELES